MYNAPFRKPGLGLVKNEFAEAFVRSAATKRAVDPTAALTEVEQEAVAHLWGMMTELRDVLEEEHAADERSKQSRRYLAHTAGNLKRRTLSASRSRAVASAVFLIEKLRDHVMSSSEATQLLELLTKLDLRRRAGGRYEDVAAADRALGF